MRAWTFLLASLSMLVAAHLTAAQTPHFWAEGVMPAPGRGPSELAGFELGWSPDQSARACRRAEQRFVPGTPVAVCSGVARETHFDAKVRLRWCEDRLCEVTAVVDDASDERYAAILTALRRAFGTEVVARLHDEEKRHYWTPGGFEAALTHRPHGHGLRIVFQSPARVLELSRTSD